MKRSVRELDVRGKRVLVRCDFNVPVQGETVRERFRLEAHEPTVSYLRKQGARVILLSHRGRPKKRDAALSLRPLLKTLTEAFGSPVGFCPETVGLEANAAVTNLKDGEVLLLENTRFSPGEEKNDPAFAQSLADLGELFVYDAFGAAHRAHASTVGVATLLPSAIGFLMEKELATLSALIENPKGPVALILGGAKTADKIGLITQFLPKIDFLLLGGGIANTFMVAEGFSVGKSVYEADMVDDVDRMIRDAEYSGVEVVTLKDAVVTTAVSAESRGRAVDDLLMIKDNEIIVDIGPKTLKAYEQPFEYAGTIIWNGPMGVTEYPQFSKGTEEMVSMMLASSAKTYVGGGDSIAVIERMGVLDRFTFVSTGGGASLEFLSGKELPIMAVLPEQGRGQ